MPSVAPGGPDVKRRCRPLLCEHAGPPYPPEVLDSMPPAPARSPCPDDKIGKKINHLAKVLGQALAPAGFKGSGRTLCRTCGEGRGRRRDIVDLQGYKWNEGAEGAFFVNLSVQFPALTEAVGRMPSQDWCLQYVKEVDEAAGHVRRRLEDLLPPEATDWPDLRDKGMVAITRQTDLAELGARLSATAERLVLPWFERHATLGAVLEDTGALGAGPLARLCAAAWLDLPDTANALMAQWAERLADGRTAPLDELLPWLAELGLDASPVRAAAQRIGH